MEDNYKAMEQIFQGSPEKDICKDVFSEWRHHQTKLITLCNNLLQHHILAQRLPPEKQETTSMDIDVQWLAEKLLQARIRANQSAYGT